jgi:hypothetical protein
MECNRLAEVHARRGPTSGPLAMVSGNRKAVEFTGRSVRVTRLTGGSQQPESRANLGLTRNRARVFTEAWEIQRRERAMGWDDEMLRMARRRQRLLSAGDNSGGKCNVGLKHFSHRTRSTTIKGIDR